MPRKIKQEKPLYTALDALERIRVKIEFSDYIPAKNHATVTSGEFKGRKVYTLTTEEKSTLPVHVSKMTGKLLGLLAISTACTSNGNCVEGMKDPNSPCHMCFAAKTLAQYNALREHMDANYTVLNSRILNDMEIRELCKKLTKAFDRRVRIEFCGDIGGIIQGLNYLRIIEIGAEYGLYFGVWTKLLNTWKNVFSEYGKKPENMTFIYSAPALDQTIEPQHLLKKYWFIDCVFIVCNKASYTEVKKSWIEKGYTVQDCKCEKGSCANNDICGYCFRSASRRKGDKPTDVNIILEVLRK